MRRGLLTLATLAALAFIWAWSAGPAPAGPPMRVSLTPNALEQGQSGLVVVEAPGVQGGLVFRFLGQEGPLVPAGPGRWAGLAAADLTANPGRQALEIWQGGRKLMEQGVTLAAKDYGTRQITVADKYVAPDPEALARHQGEMERQRVVYAGMTPKPLWRGVWGRPLDSEVVGIFGRRSLVNGQPRSPHGGVDLRGGVGTAVRAPAAGRTAYVEDTYFGGLTVLIDHGLGVITGYRHLSAAQVRPGQDVRQGQVIGSVGMSGRVTGPHLHYDLHLMGARVDPLAFIQTSQRLASLLGGS